MMVIVYRHSAQTKRKTNWKKERTNKRKENSAVWGKCAVIVDNNQKKKEIKKEQTNKQKTKKKRKRKKKEICGCVYISMSLFHDADYFSNIFCRTPRSFCLLIVFTLHTSASIDVPSHYISLCQSCMYEQYQARADHRDLDRRVVNRSKVTL